jgi:hypothetical protein
VQAGIETTVPLPWICTVRIARANRDRADAHVAVEDVPAFIAGVVRSAAGKGGHAPMIPPIEPRGKPLPIAAVGLAHLGVEHMLRRSRRPHNTLFRLRRTVTRIALGALSSFASRRRPI